MKIFFLCYPPDVSEIVGYEHGIVALAEGLSELGHEIYGNINYWQRSTDPDDFLIPAAPSSDLNDYDVVVFSFHFYALKNENLLPAGLFAKTRKYALIFIDAIAGVITPGFRDELRGADLVLKAHFNRKQDNPENFTPWQFGLTNRIIDYSKPREFRERKRVISSNFRVMHVTRRRWEEIAQQHIYSMYPKDDETDGFEVPDFSDLDMLFWRQTDKRHYPNYFERMGNTAFCCAIGGEVKTRFLYRGNMFSKIVTAAVERLATLEFERINQFDSWRLWEAFTSGCCTIHYDLGKYGCELPVMPEKNVHYLALDFADVPGFVEQISDFDHVERIAANGSSWAMMHYSPRATAERFIKLVDAL